MVTLQDVRAAQFRHARHYLEQLQAANEVYRSGGERVWQTLAQLQYDWDQIERGQSWAAQHRADASAARLCSEYPLVGSDVLPLQHPVGRRIAWLESALAAAIELDLSRTQCSHLCALGRAYWEAGEADRTQDYLQRALILAQETGDRVNLAEAHFQLGAIAEQQSDLATANHHIQTSLDHCTELKDQRGIARALLQFAAIHGYEANFAEAEHYAQRSLEQFRAVGDVAGEARALMRLGALAGNQRKNRLAEQYYAESYALYCRLNDLAGQGQTLRLMGVCATFEGNHAEARARFEQSLALFQRLGNQHSIGQAHMKLGDSASYSGDYDRAREHFQVALAIFQGLQARDDVAEGLISLSGTFEKLGQLDQAIRYALEARDVYRELGNQRWLAFTLSRLGQFASECGEFAQAEIHLTEGLAAAEASGDPWVTASVQFDWSKLERLRGAIGKARDHWCQAFELAIGIQSPPMLVEGIRYLVNILVAAEEYEFAYELAYFVAEHPTVIEGIRANVTAVLERLDAHLNGDVRQAAIARARSRDLDAYCALLRSECGF